VVHPFWWYPVVDQGSDHIGHAQVWRLTQVESGTMQCVHGSSLWNEGGLGMGPIILHYGLLVASGHCYQEDELLAEGVRDFSLGWADEAG
jgi:hypothetical protein